MADCQPDHTCATLMQSETTPELQAVEAICPSIHALHHLRGQDWRPYREGVVMRSEPGMGSFVDIGYERNAHVAQALPEGARVTLAVGNAPTPCFMPAFSETMLEARVVPPSEPRAQLGISWGFRVRVARGINRVLKEGPHKGGYDLTIGISGEGVQREAAELVLPRYRHLLVVFGGAKDLEAIADGDFSVAQAGKAAADLFSMYLNCCPESMGVAGVKREDEVLISMGYLHAALAKYRGAS
ncbi:putative RNA methyltransferase [Dunaliella salina]|uniref:RNA methyltransferase n=1 Tax=Dunaliella salina TaxID=3046 RepID=A0ABQ7GCJ4_DUNSA|nr:putative RNA methyltransferase [Dunaliella salina]|eukprot:KAF5832329.1 putative RNA methyltransferase [Dunaliella salina]